MKHRPLVLLLIPYMVGIVLGERVPGVSHTEILLLGNGLLLFFALAVLRFHPSLALTGLLLFMGAFGGVRIQLNELSFQRQTIHSLLRRPLAVILYGRLLSEPEERTTGFRCVVAVDSITRDDQTIAVQGKLLLNAKHPQTEIHTGDSFRASGTMTLAEGERTPGEFNYRLYLKRKKIAGLFYVSRDDSLTLLNRKKRMVLFARVFDIPRREIARLIQSYLHPGENAALMKGLILGLRGEITPEIRASFADTGVIHVLAVSGLHVGFVMLFLLGLATLFRLSFLHRSYFLMFGLIIYAGLTGFKVPVLRAVLMADLVLLGRILQRQSDMYNILAAAAFLILLVEPQALFAVDFQLSFAAVFSIVYFYPRFRAVVLPKQGSAQSPPGRLLRWLVELLLISFSAQIVTLPLSAIYFERIPLLGILANIVVVPLVMGIVLLGFVLIPTALLSSTLATFLGDFLSLLLTGLVSVVHWMSTFPIVRLEVAHLSPPIIIAVFAMGVLLVFSVSRKKFAVAIIVVLLAANAVVWIPLFQKHELHITFLDVGQGDSCLIELPDGRAALIDAGPRRRSFDAGTRTILPYLKRRNIHHLRAVFLTHFHIDHIGGVQSILRTLPVAALYTIERQDKNMKKQLFTLADSLHIPIHFLQAGDTLNIFSPLQIQVLSPFPYMLRDSLSFNENESSLVLRLRYGKYRFLLCGDIETQTENELLPYDSVLRADLLKSPHHGSRTSNTHAFLDRIAPRFAVISVGKWNRFGHPSTATLQRMHQRQIQCIRTDQNGAVIFATDGKILHRLR